MKIVSTENAPQAIGPYSQAIRINGLLYTSGQLALRADGSKVEGDIAMQTEQVLSNLEVEQGLITVEIGLLLSASDARE